MHTPIPVRQMNALQKARYMRLKQAEFQDRRGTPRKRQIVTELEDAMILAAVISERLAPGEAAKAIGCTGPQAVHRAAKLITAGEKLCAQLNATP